MQRSENIIDNTALPISEALFNSLVRSSPKDAALLVGSLPEVVRARLALFCNRRSHLRQIGHAIADTCSELALLREGGQAGAFLSNQTTRDLNRPYQNGSPVRPVSLAEARQFAAA